jgi:hypothetical protein
MPSLWPCGGFGWLKRSSFRVHPPSAVGLRRTGYGGREVQGSLLDVRCSAISTALRPPISDLSFQRLSFSVRSPKLLSLPFPRAEPCFSPRTLDFALWTLDLPPPPSAPAPMPLEPLHFPILHQVVPAVLLSGQPFFLYQLPRPHRRHTEDLSGLFRSDQAHLTKVVRAADGSINHIQTARRVHDKQVDLSSCFESETPLPRRYLFKR